MKFLLLAALLAAPAAAVENAPILAVGYRAMTLPMPSIQLRWIEPGDRVDVLATFEAKLGAKGEESAPEQVTATIMQNVRVLAVDMGNGMIQLEFNPNEAQYAAVFYGKDRTLWVIKRSPEDKEMHPMEMASARKLFR